MSTYPILTHAYGDGVISLYWRHSPLTGGAVTKYSFITITDSHLGTTDHERIKRHTVWYGNSNPNEDTYDVSDLLYDHNYLIMVTQVASDGSIYNSNTIEVTAPASAPDAPYLDQNDSNTVNDLTSITVKVYFPEGYSDGNSSLTHMAFSLSSDSLLYSRIVPINNDSLYLLEDLSGNVEYEIAVSAMNSVGPSGISNTILESTTSFPNFPTDFIIFTEYLPETENTKVTLKWNAPTNDSLTDLAGYYIYHSTDNDNFTRLTTYTSPLINYADSDGTYNMMSQEYLNIFTTVGETHYFYLKSFNPIGESVNPTNTLSAYIFNNASPVQNVSCVPGDQRLELNWDAPSTNGGYNVVDYKIQIFFDGSQVGNDLFSEGDTYYNITGLTNGYEYTVIINAITNNDNGNPDENFNYISYNIDGEALTITNTTTNCSTIPFTNPSDPQDVVVVPSDEQITVSWSAPSNNGGYSIDHYVVGYSFNGENSYTNVDVNSNVFTHTFTGLTNGTSYDIQLYAVSSATDSSLSTSVGLYVNVNNVIPFRQSSIVNDLTVVPGNNILDVSWTNVSDNGGFPVVSYNIYLNGDFYDNTSSQSYTIGELTNGASYNVSVSALTYPDYLSPDSLEGYLTTSDNYYPFTTPDPVLDLSAYPSNQQIEFSWNAPNYTGGFEIDHYDVAIQHESDSYIFVSNGTSTNVTYNYLQDGVTPLQNGDTYTWYVKAVTINQNDSSYLYSSTESVSSVPYTNPEPVNDLSVVPGDSILDVYFTPLSQTASNNGGYDIIEYKLGYRVTSNGSYNLISIDPNNTNYDDNQIVYTITGLTNGTGYDVEIYAISDTPNGNNNTSDYSYVYNSIPYRQASTVNNIVVTPIDNFNVPLNTRLNVTWDDVTDNGGFTVASYNVYVDGAFYVNTSNKFKMITGLTNGTYYTVSVTPLTYPEYLNGDSLEGSMNTADSVKPFKNPDPVDNFQVIPYSQTDKKINIRWNPPQDNGGNNIVDFILSIYDVDNNKLADDIVIYADSEFYEALFDINNFPSITNGTTYTVTCKVHTVTDAELDLYSSDQTIYPKPYGKPIHIEYTINTTTNELFVTMNNNGDHVSDVLICAPVSPYATAVEIARILVTSSVQNPINQTADPLIDTFSVTMNYQLETVENQPMLIVATNLAGMYYIENFSAINQVV